jgi:hypothetical protein
MYNIAMPNRAKSARTEPRKGSIRQSVTIPGPLAVEVRRVAKEHHLTVSRAVASLVARGVRAEQSERQSLDAAYDRFMNESDPANKEDAGKDLIRAVFGKDAIAEDPVL